MPSFKTIGRIAVGLAFIVAGLNHFRVPRFYQRMMPPYIPAPKEMVDISGVAEVALGAALFVPRLQPVARYGLLALLLAVFPANLHMALNADKFGGIPEWALWARLPFQPLMMAAVVYVTSQSKLEREEEQG